MDRTTDEGKARTGTAPPQAKSPQATPPRATPPQEDDTDASGARLLRGVKMAMAVMGVLILAGFGVIGYELYRRATDPGYRARIDAGAAETRAALEVRTGGSPTLLPEGAIITGTVTVGSRLALTVELLVGTQILYFANPAANELVEFLRTRPNLPAQPGQ